MKLRYNTLLIFLLFASSAFSQLTLQKVTDVEVLKFPTCRVQVRVVNNPTNNLPTKENFLVKEMHYISSGDSVVRLDDNLFYFYWTSRLPVKFPYVDIYLTLGEESVLTRFRMPLQYKLQQVRIMTPSEKPMIFFNQPMPADSFTVALNFKSMPDNAEGEYDVIKIDSIKTHTEYFVYQYGGSYKNWNPPPGDYPEGEYRFYISFKGYEDKLYTDKLSIYYNGNQKVEVDLIANSYKVNTINTITILEPKAREILTPCYLDTIVWRGGSKGLTYIVEISTDGGYNWKEIGQTLDTFLIWTVVDNITEGAYIKVHQKFKPQEQSRFSDTYGYTNSKYENNANFLAASTGIGVINEIKFDNTGTTSFQKQNYLNAKGNNSELITTTAIVYSKYNKDTRELAVTYHPSDMPDYFANDILKIFKDEEVDPIKTINLPFAVKRMEVDSKYRYLTILPQLSNNLFIYDTKDYSLNKKLTFDKPISNFKYVPFGDSLQIVLFDNTILTYSVGDFKEVRRDNFISLPLFTDIASSPDGKFNSYASLRPPTEDLPHNVSYSGYIAPVYVFENSTNINIRSYYSNTLTPLGLDFGPSSDRIVIGKASKDHITMRELSAELPSDYFNFGFESTMMTNYTFAQEGHYVAGITEDSMLYVNKFRYSEIGRMTEPFSIRFTSIDYKPLVFDNQTLDYHTTHQIKSNFCNKGDLPIILTSANLKINWIFRLQPINLPDTLYPGECIDYTIDYYSIDTGIVRDTLFFRSCAQEFAIPIESRVLPRDITLFDEGLDFGEVCVFVGNKKKVKILRNNDTIPLNIQKIFMESNGSTAIKVIGKYDNIVVPPGEDLIIEIQFTPDKLGDFSNNMFIEHSNNLKFRIARKITGKGIGVNVNISHKELAFIPELKTRTLIITNLDDKPFIINSYTITPEGTYRINTPLPINLAPKDSAKIEIEYLSDNIPSAQLNFISDPCASNAQVNIRKYSSNSTLSLIDTEADPRGEAIIKIKLNNNENLDYRGIRFLEGEFKINEKIFIPFAENAVISQYGTGKIVRNEVIDGIRYVRFIIDGYFPKEGIVAEIRGYAGLTVPSESQMEFTSSPKYFGSSVITNFKSGIFRLINLCADKMIIWQKPVINNISLSPNPADNYCNLKFESNKDSKGKIEIFNKLGIKLIAIDAISIKNGQNEFNLNTYDLKTGSYNAIIHIENEITHFNFIILK